MRQIFHPFDPRQEMQRPDFEIFHSRDTRLDSVELHHHDFYEIYCFLGGSAEYRVEGRLYRLTPGDLMLLSPMELHQVTVQSGQIPYERIVLWLSRAYLDSLGDSDSLMRCFDHMSKKHTNLLQPASGSEIYDLLGKLLEERSRHQYAGETLMRGYLLQLLVLLNRLALESPQEEMCGSLVSRAAAYLSAHYAEEIRLDGLAARLHVSKSCLCHEFRNVTGIGVYRYLTLKRLQIARELLLQGTSPGEAAAVCGYRDYPNFYRAFRARYGLSPGQCILQDMEAPTANAGSACSGPECGFLQRH